MTTSTSLALLDMPAPSATEPLTGDDIAALELLTGKRIFQLGSVVVWAACAEHPVRQAVTTVLVEQGIARPVLDDAGQLIAECYQLTVQGVAGIKATLAGIRK